MHPCALLLACRAPFLQAKKEKQAEAKAKKLEKKGLAPTNLTKK